MREAKEIGDLPPALKTNTKDQSMIVIMNEIARETKIGDKNPEKDQAAPCPILRYEY